MPKETVIEWYARIKYKAINCKFGQLLEDKLKDKFVVGLIKGPILDRVCEEEHSATLSAIYEAALKKEAAVSTTSSVAVYKVEPTQISAETQRLQGHQHKHHRSHKKDSDKKCKHCGGIKHNFVSCKYREYRCRNCNAVGHLAKVCPLSKPSSKTHFLEDVDNDTENLDYIDMLHLSKKKTLPNLF